MLKVEKSNFNEEIKIVVHPHIVEDLIASEGDIVKIRNNNEYVLVSLEENEKIDPNNIQISREIAEELNLDSGDKLSIGEEGKNLIATKKEEDRIYYDKTDGEIDFNGILGYDKKKDRLKDVLGLHSESRDEIISAGFSPPNGIVVYGSEGSIINKLGEACVSEIEEEASVIDFSKLHGIESTKVHNIFSDIIRGEKIKNDNVTLIKNMITWDSRSDWKDSIETTIDDMDQFVIITTSDGRVISDYNLEEKGFRTVNIPTPDYELRETIVHTHLPGLDQELLEHAVEKTQGYTFSEINRVCEEVFFISLKSDKEKVNKDDLNEALSNVQPSSLEGLHVEQSTKTFNEIGGLDEEIKQIKEIVEWPLRYDDLMEEYGTKTPNGILLYGPPGTGKTLLSKAVAGTSGVSFIEVDCKDIVDKFFGESEKEIGRIFQIARDNAPCVVYFDEFDAIAQHRSSSTSNNMMNRIVSQLLSEIDGINTLNDVIVMASTNRPDLIDPALTRSGRLGENIRVGLPDKNGREEIFRVHLKNIPTEDNIDYKKLASKTERYTGSDIERLCNKASINRIRDTIRNSDDEPEVKKVTEKEILEAIREQDPSYSDKIIEICNQYETGSVQMEGRQDYIH